MSFLKRNWKIFMKIVEYKPEGEIFDGIRSDAQLRHFLLFTVPISQQLPRLTSF